MAFFDMLSVKTYPKKDEPVFTVHATNAFSKVSDFEIVPDIALDATCGFYVLPRLLKLAGPWTVTNSLPILAEAPKSQYDKARVVRLLYQEFLSYSAVENNPRVMFSDVSADGKELYVLKFKEANMEQVREFRHLRKLFQ